VSAVPEDWEGDDELLAALRQAVSARQAVPAEFVTAAKNAFAWHNIDAELAQLTYDSTGEAASGLVSSGTRAEAASIRALTFTSTRLTIELEVSDDRLLGQVVPAQAATIEVQARDGEGGSPIVTDEIGCFSVRPAPAGAFRLRCRAAGGTDVLTGWVTL
jgi:hypothetical protein